MPGRRRDVFWAAGRVYMGVPARLAARARLYGRERMPAKGGVVLAVNHLHWIDVPLVGVLSPRNLAFVAKFEAVGFPGFGRFIAAHGTIAVRRGQSDRDAVRQMRAAVRGGDVLGLFVEGTRQRSGRPGEAKPGAAMVAIQEDVPVLPAAIYGTQYWKPGNFAPCSLAYGEPMHFEGLPKNGRGYKEATAELEARIHGLFDWLADVHARGLPKGVTPP
ncbi:MAG: lysophospholipid acyltransferase family protein [Gaiellaceae bacterium]